MRKNRIMAHTFQKKHLQKAIVLCQNWRNIVFILQKNIMETKLQAGFFLLRFADHMLHSYTYLIECS